MAKTPRIKLIPPTLEDAVQQIIDNSREEDLKKLKDGDLTEEQFLGATHHFLGQHIRNTWGLWNGSVLKDHFNTLGIHHADDMSGIILTSFYRKVRKEPIKLKEQVKHYKDFWAKGIK